MRYNTIREMDVSNGPGIGVSIFTQGCDRHCPGCFNPETWPFDEGKEFTCKELYDLTALLRRPYITRLSILGGEPLLPQNYQDISDTIHIARGVGHPVTVWVWTGRTFEDVYKEVCETKNENLAYILDNADYLVDGPFIQEERDVSLRFCGSRNQRVLDLARSMDEGKAVLSKYDWRDSLGLKSDDV